MNWNERFSKRTHRVRPSPIRDLDGLPSAPDTLSLVAGEPDPGAFPWQSMSESLSALMADAPRRATALSYGPTRGLPALLDEIVELMSGIGVSCTRENILVTNGAQQGIHLVASALLNEGDPVLMEAQAYPGALEVFGLLGASVCPLETGKSGKLIYLTATFQNPTGRVLDVADRESVLEAARRLNAVVLEDDPYQALRYDGAAPPTLLALDSGGAGIDAARVAYLGSFSKLIFPGIRLGWVVAPRVLIARLSALKQIEDMQPNSFAQAAMAGLLARGIEDHVARLRDHYRVRRDAMESALGGALGNRASWETPQGGFFYWLTLQEDLDAAIVLQEAAKRGVRFIPGAAFSLNGQAARNTLRLSFSNVPIPRMADAAERLAQAIDAVAGAR